MNKCNYNLGGLSFVKDEKGNWGYKPSGADSVIPFRASDELIHFYKRGSFPNPDIFGEPIFNNQPNSSITQLSDHILVNYSTTSMYLYQITHSKAVDFSEYDYLFFVIKKNGTTGWASQMGYHPSNAWKTASNDQNIENYIMTHNSNTKTRKYSLDIDFYDNYPRYLQCQGAFSGEIYEIGLGKYNYNT